MVKSFLGTRDATIPEPRGAGINLILTDPHLPDHDGINLIRLHAELLQKLCLLLRIYRNALQDLR
jgi:hypothetical protein